MWDFFHDGGFGMYPTALFGLFLLAASVRMVLSPERRFAALTIALAMLTLGSGALGTTTGLVMSFRYLDKVPEGEVAKIAALGCAEALNNAVLALLLCVLAAMLASVAALRAARTQATDATATG